MFRELRRDPYVTFYVLRKYFHRRLFFTLREFLVTTFLDAVVIFICIGGIRKKGLSDIIGSTGEWCGPLFALDGMA